MLQSYLHFRHHFSKKTNAASTTPCPPQLSTSHCIADRHAVPKLPPWWMVQDPCIAIQIQGGYISEVWKWGNETCQLFEAFQFFSDEHGNVLGFDLLSNTPTVWNGLWLPCPSQTPFFFVVEPFASKLRQSTESIILLWMKQKETIPSYINQIHAWRKSIKIPHMVSFSHQNSL